MHGSTRLPALSAYHCGKPLPGREIAVARVATAPAGCATVTSAVTTSGSATRAATYLATLDLSVSRRRALAACRALVVVMMAFLALSSPTVTTWR